MKSLFFSCLTVVALLTSCTTAEYPVCRSDGDCTSRGEFCVDARCRKCRDDKDCGGNLCVLCDQRTHQCERTPRCCMGDADCPGGNCVGYDCNKPGECAPYCSDRSCGPNRICYIQHNDDRFTSCVERGTSCNRDQQCLPGQVCRDERCAKLTLSLIWERIRSSLKLVELSHPFDEKAIYWPTARSFRLKKVFKGQTPGKYWYEANDFTAAEHGGTHIDAPVHFAKGRWSVEQIPLGRLIGPLCKIDVRKKAAQDRDYQVTVADIEGWVKKHGPLPKGAIVVIETGWSVYWGDKAKYLGTAKKKDVKNLHFPGFSKKAAEWLAKSGVVVGVGIDTPSIDPGQSKEFWAHRILYEKNIYGLENIANLEKVPAVGAMIVAMPMMIRGGSGAPARIFAVLK